MSYSELNGQFNERILCSYIMQKEMNKKSCAISRKDDSVKYIINCAGDKVLMADTGFTSRCAIGNTDDYLKSFQNATNSEIVSMGKPSLISVVIPSYASAENNLCQTLSSLCLQKYPVSTEIVVFINEPENASESSRKINTHNENLLRSIQNKAFKNFSSQWLKTQRLLEAALSNSKGNLTVKCVRQVLSGGLAGVYQTVMVSLIARVRTFCDSVMINCDRSEKIKFIEEYLQHSMLLLCDDDMKIKGANAIAKAYTHAINNDAVVLGRISLEQVETIRKYRSVLRDLMQLFFDFKYDHGLNFLTPRGIRLGDILRVGGVNVGQLFADQLFFASAARGKSQYLLDASTCISESDYPGNGNFLKRLRLYLDGENNHAFDIFENVLKRYQEDKHKGKYSVADVERIILNLKTRDIDKISLVTLLCLDKRRKR